MSAGGVRDFQQYSYHLSVTDSLSPMCSIADYVSLVTCSANIKKLDRKVPDVTPNT